MAAPAQAFDPNEFPPMTASTPPQLASPSQQVVSQEQPAPQPQLPQQAPPAPPPPELGIPQGSKMPQFAPQQQQAAPATQPGFDPNEFADSKPLPKYADGSSALTPVNWSPLDIADRYKLGLGNDAGKEQFLRNKFEDVSKDEHGNQVVKQNGTWYRMKADTFGDADAWTITKGLAKTAASMAMLGVAPESAQKMAMDNPVSKEIMSKYGENIFAPITAATQALSAPATALSAGAAAGAIAGANEIARTSLGRLEGTYIATPEEQIKDVSLESLLNFGGATILAGVKPGAGWMAEKLPGVAKFLKEAPGDSLDLIKNAYAGITVGVENFNHMLENAPAVSKAMSIAKATVGDETAAYVDYLKAKSIQQVKRVAGSAQDMMSDVYRGLSNQIAGKVGDGFKSDIQDTTSQIFRKGIEDGFLGLRNMGKELSPAEAAQLIADNAGKLPPGAKPMMKSLQQIKNNIQASGDLSGAAIGMDKESHALMSDFFQKTFDLHNVKSLDGKAGFQQLMHFSKALDDTTYKIGVSAQDNGMAAVARQMANYHENIIQKSIGDKLEAQGVGQMYKQMQSTYSSMKTQLAPLLSAQQSALKRGDKAFETVVNQLSAQPGKNVALKDGMNAAISTAEQYGSKTAQVFRDAQFAIRTNNAAVAFNPLLKPGQLTAAGLGAGMGAAALGHPGYLAAAVTGAAATSPRLAGGVASMANWMANGQGVLARMSPQMRQQMLQNPQLVRTFIGTVMRMPGIRSQVQQAAIGHASSVLQGQGNGQQ